MSKNRVVGIVVATRYEASPIFKQAAFHLADTGFYNARFHDINVLLAISGVGMEKARYAAHQLVDAGAQELISAGYCGALVPDVQLGELITDRIATSPIPVWGTAERQALANKAGARAVDMETQAIIEAGTRRGVPIRVLRVVSDRLGDDVSPLLGTSAQFSVIRILLRLWNPKMWPYLAKMYRQSRIANQHLGQAIVEYLSAAE